MDIYVSYVPHNVIGQLKTSSHELQIEIGTYAHKPMEERIANCLEEIYVYRCDIFYELRGRYSCLFKQCFGSLFKVMEDQWCLGLFSVKPRGLGRR